MVIPKCNERGDVEWQEVAESRGEGQERNRCS